MKTTLELPDELVIAAKKRAAELRRPLRSLVEEGLRSVLNGRSSEREAGRTNKIRWVTVAGQLPWDVDISDRAAMGDWLRRSDDRD